MPFSARPLVTADFTASPGESTRRARRSQFPREISGRPQACSACGKLRGSGPLERTLLSRWRCKTHGGRGRGVVRCRGQGAGPGTFAFLVVRCLRSGGIPGDCLAWEPGLVLQTSCSSVAHAACPGLLLLAEPAPANEQPRIGMAVRGDSHRLIAESHLDMVAYWSDRQRELGWHTAVGYATSPTRIAGPSVPSSSPTMNAHSESMRSWPFTTRRPPRRRHGPDAVRTQDRPGTQERHRRAPRRRSSRSRCPSCPGSSSAWSSSGTWRR